MRHQCAKCGDSLIGSTEEVEQVKQMLANSNQLVKVSEAHTIQDLCHACRRRVRLDSALGRPGGAGVQYSLQTINGYHVGGFSKRRAETFYGGENDE